MKLSDILFKIATMGCEGCPCKEFCVKGKEGEDIGQTSPGQDSE